MECRFRALLTGLVVVIYLLLGLFPLADYKGALTFLDEMVTSSLALGGVGGMFCGWAALDWTKVKQDPMAIISGQQMAQTDT